MSSSGGLLLANASMVTLVRQQEQAEQQYQQIENLMGRLSNMEAKVMERRKACDEDQKAESDMCSSKVRTLQQDLDERGSIVRRPSMFLRETDGVEPALTFRSAPSTEAGKRLADLLDEKFGHLFTCTQPRPRLRSSRKSRVELLKDDEKKQERVRHERKLQTNLEKYVTRAVNELTYKLPAEDDGDLLPEEDFLSACSSGGGGLGKRRRTRKLNVGEEEEELERWPIPLEATEMNPRLLLSYACERVTLPSGFKVFKHFTLSPMSCQLFVYLYWYVHCRFFQDNSEKEQLHLLDQVARVYVKLLNSNSLRPHRDFFFRSFPYVVANAIFSAFHYLCPGSRHLYTSAFKRILHLQIARLLTGHDVSISSLQCERHRLFPDENIKNDDTFNDSLPPLPTKNHHHQAQRLPLKNNNNNAISATEKKIDKWDESDNKDTTLLEDDNSLLQSSSASQLPATSPSKPFLRSQSGPVAAYVGGRHDLHFRPPIPAHLKALIPRQTKVPFDISQRSTLLEQYLDTKQQRHRLVYRTKPVHWCRTGGTDTYLKTTTLRNDSIHAAFLEAKQAYKTDIAHMRTDYNKALKRLDLDKRRLHEAGPLAIARYASNRVVDLKNKTTS